ncbi:hypothetical protein DYB34_002820, partial [Aphanomyces astaci]
AFLLRNCGMVCGMMLCVCTIKVTFVTSIMWFFRIPLQKSIKAAMSLCQVGEVALIFMIKAHATQLVSRSLYLQFLAATSVFLGLAPLLHRNLNELNTFHFASVVKKKSEFDSHDDDDDDGDSALLTVLPSHKRHNDATPLFVAAVFGHPKLVRWLLKHGAERLALHDHRMPTTNNTCRSTTCYLGQTALDLCGEHATDAAAVDECRRLLKEPPKIPDPPGKPSFQCHITTDHVFRHIQVAEESNKGVLRLVEKRVPHVVRKCVASLRWTTPLSNGKMIEKTSVLQVRGWRSQTTAHSRLQDAQGCTVDGLQLGTTYEVQCRAQNAVGRGDWCAIELLITPSVERGGGDSEENESDDTNHGDGS